MVSDWLCAKNETRVLGRWTRKKERGEADFSGPAFHEDAWAEHPDIRFAHLVLKENKPR